MQLFHLVAWVFRLLLYSEDWGSSKECNNNKSLFGGHLLLATPRVNPFSWIIFIIISTNTHFMNKKIRSWKCYVSTQGHTASRWPGQDMTPDLFDFRIHHLTLYAGPPFYDILLLHSCLWWEIKYRWVKSSQEQSRNVHKIW